MLRKLCWFFIPLIILVGASSVISKMILKNGNFFTLKPDTEILILGHSQPECALDDSMISHTQNLSQGGEAYFYTWQKVQKIVAKNPQVKTILISFSNNQVNEQMNKWTWEDKYMENCYPKYSFMMDWTDYKLLLSHNPLAVLKSETKSVKEFTRFALTNRKDFLRDRNWGGYLYLERQKVDSLLKTDYLVKESRDIKLELSKTNIDYLEKIVAFCKEKNVKIVFLRTPIRFDAAFLKNEMQYQQVKKIKFAEIELLDFKNYPVANEDFGDFDHLNHKGAKKFSLFFNALLSEGLLTSETKQKDIDLAIKTVILKDLIH